MAVADSEEAATTAAAGMQVGAVAIMAAVAITAVGTAAGMVAMAVGTAGTVAGTEATVAGAGIGEIPATLTVGDSASALAGDRIGATVTLMCTDTVRLGLRRIIPTVTRTRTVIPMCHLAT